MPYFIIASDDRQYNKNIPACQRKSWPQTRGVEVFEEIKWTERLYTFYVLLLVQCSIARRGEPVCSPDVGTGSISVTDRKKA